MAFGNDLYKGCCFRNYQAVRSREFSSGSLVTVYSSTLQHPMALVLHVCKQLLYHDQVRRSSAWTGVAKWKAIIMGRDGPRGCCVRKGVTPSDIQRRCLQFVYWKYLHAALCSVGYGASAVARKEYRWLSVGGIATPLKNGSVRSSVRFQGDGGEVLRRKGICGANSSLVFRPDNIISANEVS